MLPDIQPELTEDQIAQLKQARTLIPKLQAAISKAKRAGIDVSEQEKQLTQLETQLNTLYRTYVSQFTTPTNIS